MKYLVYKIVNSKEEYKRAAKADNLCSFIWDYQQYLRGQWRYDGEDNIEKIYDTWFDMLNDNGININELYS